MFERMTRRGFGAQAWVSRPAPGNFGDSECASFPFPAAEIARMSISASRVLILALGILCGLPAVVAAQPSKEPDTFNLGALGAEGLPVGKKAGKELGLPKDTLGIRILVIPDGTPAQAAGLQIDDIVVGTGRGMFVKKKDPIYTLIEALDFAAGQKTPTLKLMVVRGGKQTTIDVTLPALGRHSKTCPTECERCDKLIHESLAFLVAGQNEDGSFNAGTGGVNGKVVVTSWCGLALLASGSTPKDGPYAESIRKAADYVREHAGQEEQWPGMGGDGGDGKGGDGQGGTDSPGAGGTGPERGGGGGGGGGNGGGIGRLPPGVKPNWNQTNWPLSIAPWFLCEVLNHDRENAELLTRLKEISAQLLKNQEVTGGWAHGPGGPNALNYVELEIMSNYALAAFGMMRRMGIEVPQDPIEKALLYVEATSAGDGGVGYSTRPGQQGGGDPGRTAGGIVAFARLNQKNRPFFKKMGSFLKTNLEDVPFGHVSPVMHFLATAFACQDLPPEYWTEFMNLFRLEIMAARRPDGSFSARPTEETAQLHSNSDRNMGPYWTTGCYAIILQVKKGKLPVCTGK